MKTIEIAWPNGRVTATLRDTPTARKLWSVLPVEASASTWGDEVYFALPFPAQREADATSVVDRGAVCYWLDGGAMALLFGPTPISRAGESRLVSDANLLGMVDGDPQSLRSVKPGDLMRVARADA